MPSYKGTTKIVNSYKGTTKIVKKYKGTTLFYTSVRLPNEYQEVEYIESSGTQYIDTLLEGKNGYTLEVGVKFNSLISSYNYLAGFGTGSTNRIYFTRGQQSNSIDGYTFKNAITSTSTIALDTKYNYKSIMETGNQKLYRNGVLIASGTLTDSNTYGTIWLFATNYNGGPNGIVDAKMYYCKISYGGAVVRNFVPCYRKSDTEIGLYDLVNGVFYSNSGSGTFSKGPDV